MRTNKPNSGLPAGSHVEMQEVNVAHLQTNGPVNNERNANPNKVTKICQQIRQCDYRIGRKIFWGLVVLGLTSVCLWHLVDRICHYWSEPTSFQISVDRIHYVQFPAITLCPARKPFQGDDWDEAFQLSNFLDSPKSKLTLEDIWNEYAVTEKDVSVIAPCNEENVCNQREPLLLSLRVSKLDTVLGRCITLSQDYPVKYRGGIQTYWIVMIVPGRYEFDGGDQPAAAQFFLHNTGTVHQHEAVFLVAELSPRKPTGIGLTVKQYEFQNLSRDPCYSQNDVIDCKNQCIDKGLDQVLNCSLPFMKSKWPPCGSVSEAKQAFDQANEFYASYDWSECICQRQCQENVYAEDKETADINFGNSTLLLIQYGDNLVERVYEEYSYTFSALVSDIGGSVGIFLGLSIYSLFMLLDEYLLKRVKKKEQKDSPSHS